MSAKLGNCCRTGAQEEVKLVQLYIRCISEICFVFCIVFHCCQCLLSAHEPSKNIFLDMYGTVAACGDITSQGRVVCVCEQLALGDPLLATCSCVFVLT